MIEFRRLKQDEFQQYAESMFSILYENMCQIVPVESSREEDYTLWFESNQENLKKENHHIIVGFQRETHELIGYFQYSVQKNVFLMEEIQISSPYQGKHGVFKKIYGVVLETMPENIDVVEAYANKKNTKSIGILEKLGLTITGENKRGTSYRFRGTYADLVNWYKGVPSN